MKHKSDVSPCCSPHCCMKALERHGKGVVEGETFIVNPYHCADGERVKCPKCRNVWKYVDETTEWVCEGRQRPARVDVAEAMLRGETIEARACTWRLA